MENKPAKIETNTTLTARSICDHDCIFEADILSRTAKSVTIRIMNQVKRVKVYADDQGEYIYPLGKYSMSPIMRA